MKIAILDIYQLDYDYIKNCNRLLTVDIGRQKELDFDPKAIQLKEFGGQLKNVDSAIAGGPQSMFVLIRNA